jgi:hypothetical protein
MQKHAPEGKPDQPDERTVGNPPGTEPQWAESEAAPSGTAESQPAESGPAESEAAAATEPAPESDASQAMPLAALTTTNLVHSFLSLLALKAWEGMGLVPNALSGKTQKNLDEARLAIDAYAAVFEILRARIDEGPRREMENLLTTLRLNFVDKSAG